MDDGAVAATSIPDLADADGTATAAYQWQEWDGTAWVDLAGQSSATLSIPSDQSYVGKQVRVVATTTDALGGTTVFTGTGLWIDFASTPRMEGRLVPVDRAQAGGPDRDCGVAEHAV